MWKLNVPTIKMWHFSPWNKRHDWKEFIFWILCSQMLFHWAILPIFWILWSILEQLLKKRVTWRIFQSLSLYISVQIMFQTADWLRTSDLPVFHCRNPKGCIQYIVTHNSDPSGTNLELISFLSEWISPLWVCKFDSTWLRNSTRNMKNTDIITCLMRICMLGFCYVKV